MLISHLQKVATLGVNQSDGRERGRRESILFDTEPLGSFNLITSLSETVLVLNRDNV